MRLAVLAARLARMNRNGTVGGAGEGFGIRSLVDRIILLLLLDFRSVSVCGCGGLMIGAAWRVDDVCILAAEVAVRIHASASPSSR